MTTPTTVERARHWPQMPPTLPGEDDGAYTNRLTGADGTGRVPYDHTRNRQCSIGFHGECSDPEGRTCECPCHTPVGQLEARVADLEEALVGVWALATAHTSPNQRRGPTWGPLHHRVEQIIARRPELAEWYLRGGR